MFFLKMRILGESPVNSAQRMSPTALFGQFPEAYQPFMQADASNRYLPRKQKLAKFKQFLKMRGIIG
jgi:hypothetical protein